MKFSIRRNKDSSRAFELSLSGAGYDYTKHPEKADFIFYDSENVGRRWNELKELLQKRKGFIYPHTPLTCWIWDGVYNPLPVACNFVYAPAPKEAMQTYGYPYHIEVIGFPRCEIKGFIPTQGRKLLFVPARPRSDKGRQEKKDRMAWSFILDNLGKFEEILVCRMAGQFQDIPDRNQGKLKIITTNPKHAINPTGDMVDRIDWSDLVISTTTVAALGVARGKPTVFYGETSLPETMSGLAPKHYDTYRHLLQFPLTLENMKIDEVLDVRNAPNKKVEYWKERNIGNPFDEKRFLQIVESCLSDENQ